MCMLVVNGNIEQNIRHNILYTLHFTHSLFLPNIANNHWIYGWNVVFQSYTCAIILYKRNKNIILLCNDCYWYMCNVERKKKTENRSCFCLSHIHMYTHSITNTDAMKIERNKKLKLKWCAWQWRLKNIIVCRIVMLFIHGIEEVLHVPYQMDIFILFIFFIICVTLTLNFI